MDCYKDLLGGFYLKFVSGLALLLYWLFENYRDSKFVSQLSIYKDGLSTLHFFDMERNLIQILSMPTSFVGIVINKTQESINTHLSYFSTLACMYDLQEKSEAEMVNITSRCKTYFYGYAYKLLVMKGGPGAVLSSAEEASLQHRWKRTAAYVRGAFQRRVFGTILNLKEFNTTERLREIDRQNNRMRALCRALFIIGTLTACFS